MPEYRFNLQWSPDSAGDRFPYASSLLMETRIVLTPRGYGPVMKAVIAWAKQHIGPRSFLGSDGRFFCDPENCVIAFATEADQTMFLLRWCGEKVPFEAKYPIWINPLD